jgi:hypothetical protein
VAKSRGFNAVGTRSGTGDRRISGFDRTLDTSYTKEGGSLGIWRHWAPHAEGQAMKGGHFFPEENPNDTAAIVSRFLHA